MENTEKNEWKYLDQLHTTERGLMRIRKNLSLDTDQVVDWCREKIGLPEAEISRKGKNWYIRADGCIFTVNAHSYTIITAHREKKVKTDTKRTGMR